MVRKNKFRSKFEEHLFESIGDAPVEYEADSLDYIAKHKYFPDFTITLPDGRKRFVEAKGYLRPQDMVKMKAIKESNPDVDIRIVFAKDNKVSSKSKMKYSDWAFKNGFVFSIGGIPKGWLV